MIYASEGNANKVGFLSGQHPEWNEIETHNQEKGDGTATPSQRNRTRIQTMSDSKNTSSGGIGIGGVLFIVFLVLKLCGVIDWSWWWVTAPIWGVFALIAILLLGCLGFAAIATAFKK